MTYGIPHTVHGWGDEIVTTVAVLDETAPEGYLHVLRSTGPVILVPTVALTPVDTTPAEPEPGAWLIGGVLAINFAAAAEGGVWWRYGRGHEWRDWHETWAVLGGPGITPRRLVPVPEPVAVELPWGAEEWYICCPGDEDVVVSTPGGRHYGIGPDVAEEMAAALLAAARAARGVKP